MTVGIGVPSAADVAACCASLYGSWAVELLLGESFHPGGLGGTRALLRAGGLGPGSRFLDVGCGLGASARLASDEFGYVVEGIDPSDAAIERGSARAQATGSPIRLRVGTVSDLPYPAGSFDGVLAECVLSTVPKDEALAEIRRVLRPGGRLLISDVTRTASVEWAAEAAPLLAAAFCLAGAWLPDELAERLGGAGFAVERTIDESAELIGLLDRIAARVEMVTAVSRDLALDTVGLPGGRAIDLGLPSLRLADGLSALAAARAAAEAGALGYAAAVATWRSAS